MRFVLSAFIRYVDFLKHFKAQNILASQHYPEQMFKAIDYATSVNFPVNLIVDSGAFSAWNAGSEINFDDYIDFAKKFRAENESKFNELWFVNLDVIPGKKTDTKISSDQITAAADAGFENYCRFRNEGFDNVIHVIHQGEELSVLERLLKENPAYIGISPSNAVVTKERKKWLDETFKYVPSHVKTHGFAVTSMELMSNFNWFSVDSTTWFVLGVYGKMLIPLDRHNNVVMDDFTPIANNFVISTSPARINSEDGYATLLKKQPSLITKIDKYIEYLCKKIPISPKHIFSERGEGRVIATLYAFLKYEKQKHVCEYMSNSLF